MKSRKLAEKIEDIWFTPCYDFISVLYGSNVDRVFGKIWRYSKMENGVCTASLDTIASELGIGVTTVKRIIPILEQSKLIIDTTPKLRNATHIYEINTEEVINQYNKWFKNGCKLPEHADDVKQLGSPKESTKNSKAVVQKSLLGSPKESTSKGNRSSKRVLEDTNTLKDTIKDTVFCLNSDTEGSSTSHPMDNPPTPPKLMDKKELNKLISVRHRDLINSDSEYARLHDILEVATEDDRNIALDKLTERSRFLKETALKQLLQEGVIETKEYLEQVAHQMRKDMAE